MKLSTTHEKCHHTILWNLKSPFSIVSHFVHSQLLLKSSHSMKLGSFFTNDKLFTVAVLWNYKTIWCMCRCQLRSMASLLDVHISHIQLHYNGLNHGTDTWPYQPCYFKPVSIKSTCSTTKTCCWCGSFCMQSIALQKMCLFSGNTRHQHMVPMSPMSFCAVTHPSSSILTCGQPKVLT